MKTKTVYILKNVESSNEQKLDNIEIHKIKKIYKNGDSCGSSSHKHLIQEYVSERIRYKNGRKFIIRVFMIIVSTKPLVVLFHKGYVLLDRYDNYVSFNKAIIRPELLLKYLKETNTMNNFEFDRIYNKIKRITAYINHISMNKYYRDPRFFQVLAFDFVITAQKEPILLNIKGSPQFTIKNFKMVNDIIKIETMILKQRLFDIKNYVQSVKLDMYNSYQNSNAVFEYYEDLIYAMKQKVNFNDAAERFTKVFRNTMPDFRSKEFSSFDVIYDESEDGIKAYKGLVHKFCLKD
jgi:hypothetical protein